MTRLPVAAYVLSAALVVASSVPCAAGQAGGAGAGNAQQGQAPPAGTSGRAPRAWFGGGTGSVGQSLTGNLSLGAGRFRRLSDTDQDPPVTGTDSSTGSLTGGLFYGLDAGRAQLSAGISAFGNYYAALSDDVLVGYGGAVSGSIRFSARTTLTASQGAYLEPPLARSLQGIFGPGAGGGVIVPPGIEAGAIEERALSHTTSVGLQHQLTSRSNLNLGYGRHRYDQRSDDLVQVSDDVSVGYSLAIAQGLSFRAGYRYGTSRIEGDPDAPRTERSGVDAGLDFARGVALTRSTTLGFGAGTTVAREGGNSRFLLTGNVQVDQRIGRAWSTGVYYRRNADFVAGIAGIVVSDGAGVYLSGQVSRRVGVSAQAGVTRGNVGLEDQNPFTNYQAGAGMSIAVARDVGLRISHSYYQSGFATGELLLAPGLQDYRGQTTSLAVGWRFLQFGVGYSRARYLSNRDESLTASVSLYAPLFARTRRPDATR